VVERRVQSSLGALDEAGKRLRAWRTRVLAVSDLLVDRRVAVEAALEKLQAPTVTGHANLFVPDRAPLWRSGFGAALRSELPRVPEERVNGAILVQGGRFGGWALYVKDGVPAYDYNFLGMQRSTIAAKKPLAPGKATVRFEFAYDGGGFGKGGTGTLFVNDQKVAEGRIEHTQPVIFSGDETADVGIDLGTPVVESIGSEARSRFTGRIPKVTIQVK